MPSYLQAICQKLQGSNYGANLLEVKIDSTNPKY